MPLVRTGPLIGLISLLVLLAGLSATVGLGAAGWLAGTLYGTVMCGLLARGLHRSGAVDLGPANRVTLSRAILVGGVTALTVDALGRPGPVGLLVALAGVALVLDGVDGQVARRTGRVSPLGARFDMEIDAFLILVLSILVVPLTGPWALAIGGMRYTFVAAAWVLPWMSGTLPPRFWRKVVAAAQGALLTVAVAGVLPAVLAVGLVVAALGLLVESFGRDVLWLWRGRAVAGTVGGGVAVLGAGPGVRA